MWSKSKKEKKKKRVKLNGESGVTIENSWFWVLGCWLRL